MAKPIINLISPFDAADGYTVTFTYAGNQPYSNRLIIYNATTLTVIWNDMASDTMLMRHEIPANLTGLINGNKYCAEVVCYDQQGVASATSDKSYFWVLENPVFEFDNISEGDTIQSATINAVLDYSQANGEELIEYKFALYDHAQKLLSESPVKYDTSVMSHSFTGLENNTQYYVRATGLTDKERQLDTGMVHVYVQYENPSTYARIYAEETEAGTGIVKYYTNIIIVQPTRDDYEFENSCVLLQNDTLIYNEGFLVDGDFTMAIKIKNCAVGEVMRCADVVDNTFTLEVIDCTEGIMRFKLLVPNGMDNYVLYSEPQSFDAGTEYTVWLRRINNVYEMKVLSTYVGDDEEYNLWLGSSYPTTNLENYDVYIDLSSSTVRIDKDDVHLFYQSAEPLDADTYGDLWIGDD